MRSDDPALAAATKRVVTLEADINNLRKGMVQQLTVSGKLLKAVFALDNDYFGQRFQNQAKDQDNIDPFRDLTVATQVVEAVSEELQGASAFADSPVLRDGIANLITALESARSVATEMDKTGTASVGLPVKAEAMKARTFPENNPPGCLAEAAGSVHDLVTLMRRTRDRFSAMKLMMQEAERARSEAEDAVTPVNAEKIAAAITDELKSVQHDLTTTRAQLMSTLDSHAQSVKTVRAELERARREAAAESESRRTDRAEARSLAAEIARLVGDSLTPGESDDLEITLAVLRESLTEDQELSALAAATEGVVVDWVRVSNARIARLTKEAADGRTPAKAASATWDPAALSSRDREIAKLTEELRTVKAAAGQVDAAAKEIAALNKRVADSAASAAVQGDELKRSRADLAAAQQALAAERATRATQAAPANPAAPSAIPAALMAELETLRTQTRTTEAERKRSLDEATAQKAQLEAVNRDVASLRTQLLQSTTTLRLKEEEAKRVREATLAEQHQHNDALQQLTRQLNGQNQKLAVTTSELQSARTQVADAARQAGEVKAQSTDATTKSAQTREAELKQLNEAHARELLEVRQALAAAQGQHAQALKGTDSAGSVVTRLTAEIAAGKEAAAKAQAGYAAERAELERQRAELDKQRAALDGSLKQAEATVTEQKADLERTKRTLAAAEQRQQDASKSLTGTSGELEQAKTSITRLTAELGDARAQSAREQAEAQTRTRDLEAASKAREDKRAAEIAELRQALSAAEARHLETVSRADVAQAEVVRIKSEVTRLSAEHTKLTASLEYANARERQLGTDRDRIERERAELQARLDASRKSSEAVMGQAEQSQSTLKRQIAEAKAAESEIKAQVGKLGGENAKLGERVGLLEKELAAARSERERAQATIAELTKDRDLIKTRTAESERERLRLQEASGKAEAQLRSMGQDAERVKRAETETASRIERLTAELTQAREQLGTALAAREQASAQQAAWRDQEARLIGERDAARSTGNTAANDRERYKANLERLKLDHEALAQRLEERESQLTARLTEVSRQLGELKQSNTRLAAEGERLQAELARAGGSSSDAIREDAKEALERKASTSMWAKRLADSAAVADQARSRTSDLERKIEDQRHQLAQFEDRLARQGQSDVHLRERILEVERRESALQQQLSAARADSERLTSTLGALQRDLAVEKAKLSEAEAGKTRQRQRFEALMLEARDAVANAKRRQEQTDSDDRVIIGDLMKQVQDLRLRTGTRI